MRSTHWVSALALWIAVPAAAQDSCPDNPFKTEPGLCGCDYLDLDVAGDAAPDSCQHLDASVALDATIGVGVTIEKNAQVGSGAVVDDGVLVAARAVIAEDAYIGDGNVVGRRSLVDADTTLGTGSTLGRAVTVETSVDAGVGSLTMSYGSLLGERCRILGPNVYLGSLSEIMGGPDCEVGGDTVLARGTSVGRNVSLGSGSVLGPEVQVADGARLLANVRVRKGVQISADAQIGTGVRIGRGTVVGPGAVIGDNAVLRALVSVGANATVAPGVVVPRGTVIDAVEIPTSNQPPQVTIVSPSTAADTSAGPIAISGLVSDDSGVIANVTYRIDDGVPVVVDAFDNSTFSTQLTLPATASTLRITAFDEEGLFSSAVLLLSNCSQGTFDAVWSGGSSSEWDDPANWEGGLVPVLPTDDVFICGELQNQPELAGDVSLRTLTMSSTATLETNGHTAAVASSVVAGQITGTGLVAMQSGNLRGQVPNLSVAGTVTLDGFTRATGNIALSGNQRITVNGRSFVIDGNYTQTVSSNSRGLYMAGASDDVTITGTASFTGTTSTLSQGTLRLLGDLSAVSSDAFRPGGNFLTRFEGTTAQTVSFNRADLNDSYFGDVVIANPSGVAFTSASTLNDFRTYDLTLEDGATLQVDELYPLRPVTLNGTARLEGLSGSRAAVLDFADDLILNGTSSVFGTTVQLREGLQMAPASTLDATLVQLHSELVEPAGQYLVPRTDLVGFVTLLADTTVSYNNFNVLDGGRITPNGNHLTVDTDYTQTVSSNSRGLYMTGANDEVTITGTASFTGTTSNLSQGTLRLLGDLSAVSNDAFRPGGNFLTRFEGTTAQTVSFNRADLNDSYFGDVVIANPSGVAFTSASTLNDFRTYDLTLEDGTTLQVDELYPLRPVTLNGTARLEGLSGSRAAVLDFADDLILNGTSSVFGTTVQLREGLQMAPASTLDATLVQLHSELVEPAGQYLVPRTDLVGFVTLLADTTVSYNNFNVLDGGRITPNGNHLTVDTDYTQTVSSNSRGLYMTGANDEVTITGTASFTGTTSTLSQGTLRLLGDLSAVSNDAFRPGGNFLTRFEGSTAQTVSFNRADLNDSYFGDVVIANPSGVAFTSASTLNDFRTYDLTLEDGTTLQVDELYPLRPVTLNGTARLEGLSGSRAAVLDFADDLILNGTSSVFGTTVQLREGLQMAPASTLDATLVQLHSELVEPAGQYLVPRTDLVGFVTLLADTTVSYNNFNVLDGGRITPNGNHLTVDTDYTQTVSSNSRGLYMTGANDEVTITGTASFTGTTSTLSQGTLRLLGDLSAVSNDAFRPGGNFLTRFEGSTAQTVSFNRADLNDSYFGDVVIANPSGVAFTSASTLNDFRTYDLTLEDGTTLQVDELYPLRPVTLNGTARLEGLSGSRAAVLDFADDLNLNGTSSVFGTTVQLREGLQMAPASTLDATLVQLHRELVEPAGQYLVPRTDLVGFVTLLADTTVSYNNFNVLDGGRITPNGNHLTVDTDYTQTVSSNSRGLYMTGANDEVTITGTASFTGTTSTLSQGTLRLLGDLSAVSNDAFRPGGNFLTRFEGSTAQTVSFNRADLNDSYFGDVVIANPSGVAFTSASTLNDFRTYDLTLEDGTTLQVDELYPLRPVTLNGTARLEGLSGSRAAVLDFADDLNLNGTSSVFGTTVQLREGLQMAPASTLDATLVQLHRELVEPAGQYLVPRTDLVGAVTLLADKTVSYDDFNALSGSRITLNGHHLTVDTDYTQNVNSSSQGLYMLGANDEVTITGTATFSGTNPTLNNGVLRLEGDLVATSSSSFRPASNVTTRFAGSSPQTISFNRGGTSGSYFGTMVVDVGAEVTFVDPPSTSQFYTTAGLTVAGDLTVAAGVSPLVNGNLTVPAGGLIDNNGSVFQVNGTCDIQGTFQGLSGCP